MATGSNITSFWMWDKLEVSDQFGGVRCRRIVHNHQADEEKWSGKRKLYYERSELGL
jgi:hypothetical protein